MGWREWDLSKKIILWAHTRVTKCKIILGSQRSIQNYNKLIFYGIFYVDIIFNWFWEPNIILHLVTNVCARSIIFFDKSNSRQPITRPNKKSKNKNKIWILHSTFAYISEHAQKQNESTNTPRSRTNTPLIASLPRHLAIVAAPAARFPVPLELQCSPTVCTIVTAKLFISYGS